MMPRASQESRWDYLPNEIKNEIKEYARASAWDGVMAQLINVTRGIKKHFDDNWPYIYEKNFICRKYKGRRKHDISWTVHVNREDKYVWRTYMAKISNAKKYDLKKMLRPVNIVGYKPPSYYAIPGFIDKFAGYPDIEVAQRYIKMKDKILRDIAAGCVNAY